MTARRSGPGYDVPTRSMALDLPSAWTRSAARILAQDARKILVLGETDRGKSTYCAFLAQALLSQRVEVAFVDADVGQKDTGLPATVSLAVPERDRPLSEAPLAGFYFVGAVNPVGHFLELVVGTERMVRAAVAQAERVIVNTTGLISGIGRPLKAMKIDAVQPDVIVTLERSRELDALWREHRHLPWIRLPASRRAAAKSARERARARERRFRDYFARANVVSLGLESVVVQQAPSSRRERVVGLPAVSAERTTERAARSGRDGYKSIAPGFEQGLLCGLADARGEGLGLAIGQSLDSQETRISVLTPVLQRDIRVVRFGSLCLHSDGRALRHT